MASDILETLEKDEELRKKLSKLVASEILLDPEIRIALVEKSLELLATKKDLRDTEGRLRREIRETEGRLRGEIRETEERLRSEIKDTEEKLRAEIKDTEDRLRSEIRETEERLKGEIATIKDELKGYVDVRIADLQKSMQIGFTVLGIMIAGFALLVGLR
ncbi:hypothetical protein [Candidatus Pyrohabitans sp.]